jgi:hypothetical protein
MGEDGGTTRGAGATDADAADGASDHGENTAPCEDAAALKTGGAGNADIDGALG